MGSTVSNEQVGQDGCEPLVGQHYSTLSVEL